MTPKRIYYFIFILTACAFGGCRSIPPDIQGIEDAILNPDYSGTTIPPNIAPLNFNIQNGENKYIVVFRSSDSKEIFRIKARRGHVRMRSGQWAKALKICKGNELNIDIYALKDKSWKRFNAVRILVADDSIDPFLVYRLIEPGYESWNKMGIYQRDLESFRQKTIVSNEMTNGNCMNCHSFCRNNPDNMLFHARGQPGGTIIARNNEIYKVNTKTGRNLSAGVYPAWHPGTRYVAFSVNHIVQTFHALTGKRVEVIDTLSDIILYDADKNSVLNVAVIAKEDEFETFPAWSPDGKFLYYCSSKSSSIKDYQEIRYNLLRISFDEKSGEFAEHPDTVISADKDDYSVSFPRISPDGKYLMYCQTAYGIFTIWHDDSDIKIMDLENHLITKPAINSQKSESYHSWSSNGRWIVFSSRRINGLYTNLYISYFDRNGICHKPFLLPQKDPHTNVKLTKSYNVPELITSKIKYNPHRMARAVKSEARQASAD